MQVQAMTTVETIISAGVSAAVGWLVASVTKVSKTEFKDVIKRLDTLEKEINGRMTRAEFDGAFSKVERLVWDFRSEARSEFKELKSELKTKT